MKKIDFGPNASGNQNPNQKDGEGGSSYDVDNVSESSMSVTSSAGRMLGRLRDAATLAISVTTGRKLNM